MAVLNTQVKLGSAKALDSSFFMAQRGHLVALGCAFFFAVHETEVILGIDMALLSYLLIPQLGIFVAPGTPSPFFTRNPANNRGSPDLDQLPFDTNTRPARRSGSRFGR